jgi:hypothetical protein
MLPLALAPVLGYAVAVTIAAIVGARAVMSAAAEMAHPGEIAAIVAVRAGGALWTPSKTRRPDEATQ